MMLREITATLRAERALQALVTFSGPIHSSGRPSAVVTYTKKNASLKQLLETCFFCPLSLFSKTKKEDYEIILLSVCPP
jgi:hypothetical protein